MQDKNAVPFSGIFLALKHLKFFLIICIKIQKLIIPEYFKQRIFVTLN